MFSSRIHIVILGPPAVGKLTVSRRLSEIINFPIFDNSKTVSIASIIYGYGTTEFRQFRDKLRFTFYNEVSKGETIQGLISTNVLRHPNNWIYFNKVEQIFTNYNWKTIYVLLIAELEVLFERVEQSDRLTKHSLHTKNELLNWLSENPLHSKIHYKKCKIIDTSNSDISEVVNKIIDLIV